ncbi:MAG: hypothetical protein ACLU3I_19955 [Acutalibacteraceae bacterium]
MSTNRRPTKAGLEINIDDEPVIEVRGGACPYVSRRRIQAGKGASRISTLPHRLASDSDSGASDHGGFTDCKLLQQGAM